MKKIYLYNIIIFFVGLSVIGLINCGEKGLNSCQKSTSSTAKTHPLSSPLIKGVQQFDVPGDGNCMLHAFSLAYLLPVRKNDEELKERFEKIFNNPLSNNFNDKVKANDYQNIIDIIKSLKPGDKFSIISISDKKWIDLLNKLRNKLTFYLNVNKNDLESFFSPGEGAEGTKTYDKYIEKTKKNGIYLGQLHLVALNQILDYPIRVHNIKDEIIHDTTEFNHNRSNLKPIILFHLGIHYNFGLEENFIK